MTPWPVWGAAYILLSTRRPPQSGGFVLDEEQPLKEQAAERILVRWQYTGLPWDPDGSASTGAKRAPPAGYVEMPGFPGVFVGVREDVLGNVKDTRPNEARPSQVRRQG